MQPIDSALLFEFFYISGRKLLH